MSASTVVNGAGHVFAHRLIEVLEAAHEERRPRTLSGLFAPISIPVSVDYHDGHGTVYRTVAEIRFTGFHQGATTIFQKAEVVQGDERADDRAKVGGQTVDN